MLQLGDACTNVNLLVMLLWVALLEPPELFVLLLLLAVLRLTKSVVNLCHKMLMCLALLSLPRPSFLLCVFYHPFSPRHPPQ